jgi:hypothetical protein
MANGTRDDTDDNPLRDLVEIISRRASRHTRPQPETDRRATRVESPAPPGVDLTATSVEDIVRRDPGIIEQVHEVAYATAGIAEQRRTVRVQAATGLEILSFFDTYRPALPAELRANLDAALDRVRRKAYAANTSTRLLCPFCNGNTVVPLPDLSALVCIDYECAPTAPRVIDPTAAQPAERRITLNHLALLANLPEGTVRKRLQRAKIEPAHTGPHGKHEYRWADVAHLVERKPAARTVMTQARAA